MVPMGVSMSSIVFVLFLLSSIFHLFEDLVSFNFWALIFGILVIFIISYHLHFNLGALVNLWWKHLSVINMVAVLPEFIINWSAPWAHVRKVITLILVVPWVAVFFFGRLEISTIKFWIHVLLTGHILHIIWFIVLVVQFSISVVYCLWHVLCIGLLDNWANVMFLESHKNANNNHADNGEERLLHHSLLETWFLSPCGHATHHSETTEQTE